MFFAGSKNDCEILRYTNQKIRSNEKIQSDTVSIEAIVLINDVVCL
jgi:hypothetical protein